MIVRVGLVAAAVTTELRRAVLRPAWAPGTPMHADDDPAALHLAAFDDTAATDTAADDTADPAPAAIGACIVFVAPCPHHPDVSGAWQLRAMATAPDARGRGVGTAVLAAAVATVAERGGTLVWCKARSSALGFYRANGFAIDSPEYVEPETNLAHHDMSRTIQR